MPEKILLIDDEIQNLSILQSRLKSDNFDVLTASDPQIGIKLARSANPDIILLDVNMPAMSGFDVCRRLKSDFATSHIPIVLLTCLDDLSAKVEGLDEAGADDYLVKDRVDFREMAARLRSILRRVRSSRSSNPLTGLPGNDEITERMKKIIESGNPFSVAYIDIDNFKAYNDHYGFARGDQVILGVAGAIREAVERNGSPLDFIGHIGGDDFVIIGDPFKIRGVANTSIELVKKMAPRFYDETDRSRGGIITKDRLGVSRFFSFFGITVAIVDVDPSNEKPTPEHIAQVASKIKKVLKNRGGNHSGGYEVLIKNRK